MRTDTSIVIPVKEYDTAKVTVSSMTVILAAVGFVVVLPLVLLRNWNRNLGQ